MASSLMDSHGIALVTAMALSGTVLLVALCRPRPFLSACPPASRFDGLSARSSSLRPCIVTAERKREEKKKKKRVRFAEDVMVEFNNKEEDDYDDEDETAMLVPEITQVVHCGSDGAPEMPTNWAAMYSGILQDRVQRMTCY